MPVARCELLVVRVGGLGGDEIDCGLAQLRVLVAEVLPGGEGEGVGLLAPRPHAQLGQTHLHRRPLALYRLVDASGGERRIPKDWVRVDEHVAEVLAAEARDVRREVAIGVLVPLVRTQYAEHVVRDVEQPDQARL